MPELRHAGIVVQDLDRSLAFWRDWLGFTVVSHEGEQGPFFESLIGVSGAVATVVKLAGPSGGMIELLRFHSPDAHRNGDRTLTTVGLTHVAVTIESLDALGWIGCPLNGEGTARVCFVTDPDGTLVELVEPVPLSAAPLDYLACTYDPARVPYTLYPKRLAKWLDEAVIGDARGPGSLVDFGCGRGEYLAAFYDLGYGVLGIDQSAEARRFTTFPVVVADVESATPVVAAGAFRVAFSKSVIEHCRNPLAHLTQMRSALAPGGVAIVLTPSWEHHAWGPFYIDHTHVSPFTVPSLQTAMELAGFHSVTTRLFTQLPFLWALPWLTPLVRAFAALHLPYRPYHARAPWPEGLNTVIRFSRELMILGVGVA